MVEAWSIQRALNELELNSGANYEEVKSAYRELMQFWHPDGFQNDPKRHKRALEKTKQLNAAYEFLSKISRQRDHKFDFEKAYETPSSDEKEDTHGSYTNH